MKKIRQEFADTMLEVGAQDPSLVVLVGDISHGILQPFAKACPGRYYNIGICEPCIVNMAAGLNKVGLIPVVHTIAPFIIERAYEQIKLDFGYQNLSGNLVSVGGSFDYSQLGCSHHCYTDVSLLSHLKRSRVVIPGTAKEFNLLFKQMYQGPYINYFRLPENSHGVDFSPEEVVFGRGIKVRQGRDITLVTTGSSLRIVLEAGEELRKLGISSEILYYHTLKPFDGDLFRQSIGKTGKFVSVEELSAHDGLYNLCLRSLPQGQSPISSQIAIEDFIHHYGEFRDLCKVAGLTTENICRACVNLVRT
jgi:transketolase